MSDWSFSEFDEVVRRTLGALRTYVAESRAGREPVIRRRSVRNVIEELDLRRWIVDGGMDADGFEEFLEKYLACSTRLHHPAYLAHQVAVPDFPAAIADLMHGVIHNPMAMYEMGQPAAAAELVVIDWMLEKVGWSATGPGRGSGVLTHGGSLANLTALLAARAKADPEVWERGMTGKLAILAPPNTHYSVQRAASIIGIGSRGVYPLDVDGNQVVDPDRLRTALHRAHDDGRQVMAVVANACATGTGLHDPLDELGSFCREEGLWLHVDGAHGASALLSATERRLLGGIEKADSMTWDAHKMLRASGLCTAVLFRDAGTLDRAFRQKASYLFYGDNERGIDLIERTVECTKAALGVKVFLTLAWRGERGLAEYVENQYGLTRRLHGRIARREGFECPYVPESNILCFRYGADDRRQLEIRERLLEAGRFHITSTEIHERRYLRLTVMSPQTTEQTIDDLLEAIERIAVEIDNEWRRRRSSRGV